MDHHKYLLMIAIRVETLNYFPGRRSRILRTTSFAFKKKFIA